MAQILDPLPPDGAGPIVCCYVNATSKIQVARITNVANWYFERVVFPGQRLIFEALPFAQLEIHTGMVASAILSDTIPCIRLKMPEAPETLLEDIDVEPLTHSSQVDTQASLRTPVKPVSAALNVERIA